MRTLEDILRKAVDSGSKRVVVADAAEEEVLTALEDARRKGFAEGLLVGDYEKIRKTADKVGVDLTKYEIIEEKNSSETAKIAVRMVKEHKADILMKGLVGTADYMKAILNKETGILKEKCLLSHIAVFEVPTYHKLLSVTDAGINIAPTLDEKVQIISNAVGMAHSLGIENPKVACVAAVEKVNPGKMPATEESAILTMMNRRGQIPGCIVDGPLGLDNAINKKAAEIKGVSGEVVGDADIILCPDIECANVLYKSLQFFAKARCAAFVAGTPVPIVLTSRADSHETKLASIALCVVMSHNK